MLAIYALVWCQALHPSGAGAHSCLSYGGQPTFASREACEAYAAPLRLRIARIRGGTATIECIGRIIPSPRDAG
jgi:hypothetical protein